jgi:shikimate kinase
VRFFSGVERNGMRIVLIGFRGTGKTTVARRLALLLGWDWVDADVEIELRAGKSIKAIFDNEGEDCFRQWEVEVLRDLFRRDRVVIAAGGGVVLRPENRRLLRQGASVVWLTADTTTILARIASDPTTATRRPNLTVRQDRDEVEHLLAAREPFYRQCADRIVDTVGKTADEIAATIVQQLDLITRPPTKS